MITIKRHNIVWVTIVFLAALLLSGCGHDEPAQDEIFVQTDVYPVQGTPVRRAHTFDNTTALQTEAHFTCTAYNAGSLTAYIPTTTVDWNSSTSRWEFNGGSSHYFWPLPATPGGTYPSLDFFAYMPASGALPSYISDGPTYSLSGSLATPNVSFSVSNMPVALTPSDTTKELVFAVTTAQNKTNASSGVPLVFRHPFARLKFRVMGSDVTVNSVTISGIKNNGTCTFDGSTITWTPSGDPANLVITGTPATGDTPYIVIPQTFASDLTFTVNASWNDWGDTPVEHTLSTTVPVSWSPGYSYSYSFNITPEDLTVNVTNFTEQW